ncbi:hypothetical protein D0469_20445 [Peribacillus saganii]|uniref:Uncharacterized protein n=1 Tax=Peribacillus saganii TaxID=2303992 RepID=A0A372LCB3_9BACI|nr:hypothetical protein D0469_20445 [Peribacillus saganii]
MNLIEAKEVFNLFPRRQERGPTPPIFSLGPVRRPPVQHTTHNFLSQFRTSDGSFDFAKIAGTAQQAMGMYNQVKPLIGPFIGFVITKALKK